MNYQFATTPINGATPILLHQDDGTTLGISPDPANRDYAAYLAWLAAGNTPEPAPEPPAPEPLTPAEKLAASGLTVTELKALLGLK